MIDIRCFSSLRVRLALLLSVIIIPGLILLARQGFREETLAHENLKLEAQRLAARIGMVSKEVLPEPKMFLEKLATVPEVLEGGRRCDVLLAQSLRVNYFFDNLFVLDTAGDVICSGVPTKSPLNGSHRAYFQRAMASKKFAIGDFHLTLQRKVPVVVFALPLLDANGTVKGVVGAGVQLSWFQDAFNRALKSAQSSDIAATAVDETGVIAASAPNASYIGQTVPTWNKVVQQLKNGELLVENEQWLNGESRSTAYLPLYFSDTASLYLRVGILPESAVADARRHAKQNYFIFFLVALFAAAMAWLISNWLVLKPIQRLKTTTKLLANGDFSARTGLKTLPGEIGEVAKRFDNMAEQLERHHEMLIRLNRLQALRTATNSATLRAENEDTLLKDLCNLVQGVGNYYFAWIAYFVKGDTAKIVLKAHAGAQITMFNDSFVSDKLSSLIRKAAQAGRPQLEHLLDCSLPAGIFPSRPNDATSNTAIALPVKVGDKIIGGLGILCVKPDPFADDEIRLLVDMATDIGFGIYTLRADKNLVRSQEMLGMVVENIPSMIFVKNAIDFSFVRINQAGEQLVGYSREEMLGKTDFDLFPENQARSFREADNKVLNENKQIVIPDELVRTKSGEIRLLYTRKLLLTGYDGRPQYLLGICDDITEQRAAQDRLVYLANHDHLTGLANRSLLLSLLLDAMSKTTVSQIAIGVLYIDLDGFKEVNDTLGHDVGDALLRVVSQVLCSIASKTEVVARVGGDEFVILMHHVESLDAAMKMAELVRARCEKPFLIDQVEIFISASIGISVYPWLAESHEELLGTADIAMYAAKARGRNTYAVFSQDMRTKAMQRIEMRNCLRHAIERNELVVHYQPRINVLSGKIVGAEALLRWDSADLGKVSPVDFIPLAEDSGLIISIGEWVLRQACTDAQQWQDLYGAPIHIAVNLSPRQLRHEGIGQTIKKVLRDTNLDPSLLELEVTEGAFSIKDEHHLMLLNEISAIGIQIAIDDFGTGYSNLSYLKQLPVDALKIDKSFISGLTSDKNDEAIVTAVIAMAKSLELSSVAEGVESEEQLQFLANLACTEYQGFFFSRPLPLAQFNVLLGKSL